VQHVLFVDYQLAQITNVEAVIVQSIGGNLWIMILPRLRSVMERIIGVPVLGTAMFLLLLLGVALL
jgi:hypothetical protein